MYFESGARTKCGRQDTRAAPAPAYINELVNTRAPVVLMGEVGVDSSHAWGFVFAVLNADVEPLVFNWDVPSRAD